MSGVKRLTIPVSYSTSVRCIKDGPDIFATTINNFTNDITTVFSENFNF